MEINIGITETNRKDIAESLGKFLADTYSLYLLTQNFHWNVRGPTFHSLHTLFETHYQELAEAVDMIAERIRALDCFSPGTFAQFSELSMIKQPEDQLTANEMVQCLVNAHETVIEHAQTLYVKVEEANDVVTADLLTQRMYVHEKAAWMLRSLLEK